MSPLPCVDVRVETTDLMGDPKVAATQARLMDRMAYWTKESADVFDQNSLNFDTRSNPMLNKEKAWLPWCPDDGCSPDSP